MSEAFDPYLKWLGIFPKDQPPNHYRLLGIDLFVDDADVIETAADQRMMLVRSFQTGKHAEESQKILNEIAAARVSLLDPQQKAAYDARLRAGLAQAEREPILRTRAAPAAPPGPAARATEPAVKISTGKSGPTSRVRKSKSAWPLLVAAGIGALGLALLVIIYLTSNGGAAPEDEVAREIGENEKPGRQRQTSAAEQPPAIQPKSKPADKPEPKPDAPQPEDKPESKPDAPRPEKKPEPKPPEVKAPPPAPPEKKTSASADKRSEKPPGDDQAARDTGKAPVPADAAQQEALAIIRDVFANEYKQAKTDQQQSALAEKLLLEGSGTDDDPVGRFVLLRLARDIATGAGDVDTALGAIDRLAQDYQIDALAQTAETLAQVAAETRSTEEHRTLVAHASAATVKAIAADRYELARRLGKLAQSSALKTRDRALRKEVAASLKRLEQLAREYAQVESALTKLQDAADDPTAHLTVARYRCFTQGDWDLGLPHLARSGDAQLEAAAAADLARPTSTEEQIALGDRWWELGEKQGQPAQDACKQRAAYWYEQAAPVATGLAKAKVKKRLEEARKSAQTAPASRPAPPLLDQLGRINPAHWKVRCWENLWIPYPLDKMTVQYQEGVLSAMDTTGIHRYALLVFEPFVAKGDFRLAGEIQGRITRMGIWNISGADSTAFFNKVPNDNQWHQFVLERSGGEMGMTFDGRPVTLSFTRCDQNIVGNFAIALSSGHACGVRRLIVQTPREK